MKKDISANKTDKKAGVVILTSDKIDFNTKAITHKRQRRA